MRFFLISLSFITLTGCFQSYEIPKATVKITNIAGNSGGSGSVVYTSKSKSQVLTNAHVCGVAKSGGLVHDIRGKSHSITEYVVSNIHDLCLVTVAEELPGSVRLASRAPAFLSGALASGHPKLMPLVLSPGHFSGKQLIQVLIGIRACTFEEASDPSTALFCLLANGLPLVKNYEAQAITTLIQPGSSGSAVYNSDAEISAVVFAGSGDIGYGYSVPYEFVYKFLKEEVKTLTPQYPDPFMHFGTTSSRNVTVKRFVEICNSTPGLIETNVCKSFMSSLKNNDLIERN